LVPLQTARIVALMARACYEPLKALFVIDKESVAYVVTAVACTTRCILGWDVLWERTTAPLQELVERSRQACLEPPPA
jgi:hypothetical protein